MPQFDPAVLLEDAGIETRPAAATNWSPRPTVQQGAEAPSGGVGEFFKTAVKRDWAVYGLADAAAQEGIEYDENFSLADVSNAEWKEMTKGIPEEYWENLASAKSRTHLHYLIDRTREGLEAEEKLASYGGWGVAGRLVTGALDPAGILLAMGSGGLTVASKAKRLTDAVRAARAAEEFSAARAALTALQTAGRDISGAKSAAKVGLLAAAENMALEGAVVQGDPTRDGWDVAQAGLAGLVIGGIAGKWMSRGEKAAMQHAFQRESQLLKLAEFDEALKVRRGDILQKLNGNPEEIREALRQLDLDVARFRDAGIDIDHADVGAIKARIAEIDAVTGAHVDNLRLQAADAPKRSELGSLRREVTELKKQLKKMEGEEGRAEARMLAEDQAALGPEVAGNKQRTKMRQRAAAKEVGQRRTELTARLSRAASEEQRLTAADLARTELRRVERLNKDGKLAAEGAQLREALGLAARAQDLAPKRKLIEDLDNVETLRDTADTATAAVHEGRTPEVREDTLSAARAVGVVDDITEMLKLPSDNLPVQGRMQFAAATKLVGGTFSGVLRGSTSAKIRSTLGRLVGNAVGAEDASRVDVGASEVAARIAETKQAKFNSAVTPAYREWAERLGYGLFARQTRAVRSAFMTEVGKFIRGELLDDVDPAVKKVAARQSELYAEFLQEAKDAGVKGFENVEPNGAYLPRVFDFDKLGRLEKDFGTEGINQLVVGAIRAANEDMPEELADKVGRAYVKRLRQLRVGSDAHLMQGVRWDDVGFLRQFLTDSGMGAEEINKVVDDFAALNAARERQTEGSFRYAKKRQAIDETYSLKLRRLNAAGESEFVEVRLSDILENNAESLFQRYTRSVSGHIGLAKVGIKSRGEFEAMIREAENELQHVPDELEKVKDYAETAYKLITGQPIENATLFNRISRTARDWNFATTMNQAGFAQIPDLAALLSKGYLRYTLSNFGWAMRAIKRTDGSLDDEFARELEEWVGLGTDYHNNAVYSAYDHEAGGVEAVGSVFGHTARVIGRGTQAASGMAFITSITQRMAGKAIVQRLVKETLEGGAFSARRAADLGLDADISKRIGDQIRKHTQFLDNEAGGKVRIVNWGGWDDVEARDAMLNAVFREARRIVQEEDLGDTSKWMHSSLGKMIVQFRRFALVSYSKQLLHGISHRDAESATRFLVSMALAGLAYKARWELRLAMTSDENERNKLREENLSWDRVSAASFANSSYSALLPAVYDSTVGELNDAKLFNVRTSGLNSDAFRGIPTVALAYNAGSTLKALYQSSLRGDRQFTQSDARALRKLLPYQNLLGMDYVFNTLTSSLPEKNIDGDPDEIDWGFND